MDRTYAIMYMQTTIARSAVETVLVAVRDVLLRLRVAVLFAQTEVDQQDAVAVLALAEQEITRLEVTMDDVLRVYVLEMLNLRGEKKMRDQYDER